MIKKLCLYAMDCIKSSSSGFNNLKSSKDNKIIITDSMRFGADDKAIVEMMTKYALNKSTMSILYGSMLADGIIKNQKIYSPLLYASAELVRDGDEIILIPEEFNINYGLISSLLNNDSETVEIVINQLMQIEDVMQIDFIKVLSGLIPDINKLSIADKKAIILSKTPESTAGLINELRQIADEY